MSDYTIKTEKQARTAAEKLAKVMGDGWTPRVHENLGWHYRAEWGNLISIYPIRYRKNKKITYHCLLSDYEGECRGGSGLWTKNNEKDYECPKKCVAATLKRANMVVENLNKVINKVNKCI